MALTVVVDTREKIPWEFAGSKTITNFVSQKVDTGDYAILGLEDMLCLERKRSVEEFAGNVTQKRFWKEVERMKEIPNRFIILEFSIDDILHYPVGSNIPRSKWKYLKVKGPFIMRKISELQVEHGVQVVFCGNTEHAEYVAANIIKRVYEQSSA